MLGNTMKAKRYPACLLLFAVLISLALGGDANATVAMEKSGKPAAISAVSLKIGKQLVTKKTYRMKRGEKKKLKVTVTPKKVKKSIRYKTGNKKTVTVSKDGTIAAKSAGTAKISVTVKSGKKKKTAWVKIRVIGPANETQLTATDAPGATPSPYNPISPSPAATDAPSATPSPYNSISPSPTATDAPNATPSPDVSALPTATAQPVQTTEPTKEPENVDGKKNIVIYFSCTDNTKKVAEHIAEIADADIYRIEAAEPYTSEDLNYNNSDSRTSKENRDAAARPEIAGELPSLEGYANVYLGYPIWHGQAPKIMYTFVEHYNLSGKTIIPFCTSASSGVGTSATNLQSVHTGQALWLDGKRFSGSSAKSEIEGWILELGLHGEQ